MNVSFFKAKSLAGKIFTSVSAFTIVVIVVFSLVVSAVFYFIYENDAEQELRTAAQGAAVYLSGLSESEQAEALRGQFAGNTRSTLIAADGEVLYDSYQPEASLENHGNRPEVRQALASGEASSVRYSDTLHTDAVYAAVKTDGGTVIRLAETRHSAFNFLLSVALPITASLVVAVVAVFFLSRVLTRRIMRPINALNFKEPLDNEIYEEMQPLLERIDEQQALLKEQNDELALAESLRRDFSANVSHEMKTPLQVISGYAELLKNDMVEPADQRKFAALIYDEAQAMRSLINDVLMLSRLDESAVGNADQPVNLYATALRACARLESFAAAAKVTARVEGEAAQLTGNDTLIEEMFYNLVENGIRYNCEGGEVVVAIHELDDGVSVLVRDTGMGIPANQTEKIFERFFRVDKSRSKETGGTGLGLAIVKHAVQYHGGTIEVESQLGKGTSFNLHFPL